MAGRTVLIKSVLASIPAYQMQTLLIPKGILQEIEKVSRDFFWNQSPDTKKLHLIAWDTIKEERKDGGLGIKDLQCQNRAFIMKLCWGLLTQPDSLWVKCLRYKYDCGEGKYPKVEKKREQSAVWQGITTVWELFMEGVGCKLSRGVDTNAWTDRWTSLDRPLMEYVDRNQHLLEHSATVNQFVTASGGWNMSQWQLFLPSWVLEKIKLIKPPNGSSKDGFYWRGSSDGRFTVKSAYHLNRNAPNHSSNQLWQKVWRWDIPEKAKYFLWQVFHERLPTNSFRSKRVPSNNPNCPFECSCEETILHTLRDCEDAKRVWLKLVDPLYVYVFFSGNLQEWLNWNLSHNPVSKTFSRWSWSRIFGLTCWLVWKNRCKRVFDGSGDKAKELLNRCSFLLMEGVENNRLTHQIFQITERSNNRWTPPPVGFTRVDVDGSVNIHGSAAVGGVLRSDQGNWLSGFQQNVGYAASTTAEILAIGTGLRVCKLLGLTRIKLYSDSMEAIHLLSIGCGREHPLWEEITEIRNIIFSEWDLEITHADRETMRCADHLAKTAHELGTEVNYLSNPPTRCRELIEQDLWDHAVGSPSQHSVVSLF